MQEQPHRTRSARLVTTLASLVILSLTNTAAGYRIESVTVLPANTITSEDSVSLEVVIMTPTIGNWLDQPTRITASSSEIIVDIYPDSAQLHSIGYLDVSVPLGTFQPGTQAYTVVVHPPSTSVWEVSSVTDSFEVECTQGAECDCILPPDVGPCDGVCPRYFFNIETGQCQPFDYGCCDGNANNFLTLEDCESACGLFISQPVPAVSTWGIFATVLFGLTAGVFVISRAGRASARLSGVSEVPSGK